MTLPVVSHGRGCYLYDEHGKDYLDGSSGVLNVNLGHANPEVLDRIRRQLDQVCFVHRSQFDSRPLAELTERLLQVAPPGMTGVEYTNSGSEAIECALRIALAHHQRSGQPGRRFVLTEQPSYHGMTAGALSISGQPHRRDVAFQPLLDSGVTGGRVRPASGRLRAGLSEWEAAVHQAGPGNVAAVVVEPVGGASSGAAPMAAATLRGLQRLAHEAGFLLVADEVMCGLGRTGLWWGCDIAGVSPDLLVTGKGLTGGYTSLAVTLVAERVTRPLEQPIGRIVQGHTMSGNPLAAATALAVLDQLDVYHLPARAARMGEELRARLERLRARHRAVREVRGRGLMLGMGLAGDPERPLLTARTLVSAALAEGLILCPAGIDAATESVLVAPPLTVRPEELDELTGRLDRALKGMKAEHLG